MKATKLVLALFITLFIASCSNAPEELKRIPKEASFVITFNPANLQDKSGIKNFSETKFYKSLMKDSIGLNSNNNLCKDFMKFDYIFKNGEESGVDFSKELFGYQMGFKGGWHQAIALNFGITDAGKFKAMLEKAAENHNDSLEFKEEKGISYLVSIKKQNNTIIAWNKTTAIIYIKTKGGTSNKHLFNKCEYILNLSSGNSMANNESFVEFYQNRKDFNIWITSKFLLSKLPSEIYLITSTQFPIPLDGIEYRYYVNFEKGYADVKSELILPEDLKDFVSEYKIIKDDFDKDVLNLVPKNSLFNFSFAVNLHEFYRMIKALYEERQVDVKELEEMVNSKLNTDIERVMKAINGEVVINIHDVELVKTKIDLSFREHEDSLNPAIPYEITSVQFLFSAIIKLDDPEVYDLLIKLARDNEELESKNGYIILSEGNEKGLYAALYKNIMMLTNDQQLMENFVANEKQSPSLADSEIGKHLDNYAMYGMVNLNYDSYPTDIKHYFDSTYQKKDKINIRNIFNKISIEPQNSYESKMIIELKDKDRNSLEVMLGGE